MKIQKKQVLVFGYGLPLILSFIAYRLWMKHGWIGVPSAMVVGAFVLLGFTIVNWQRIIPFYKKWMKVVHFIGQIITSILLSVVFYLVFGIAGIVLRLLRKDFLDRKIESEKESYWIRKPIIPLEKERYKQQF